MSPTFERTPVRVVGGPHDGRIVHIEPGTRRITMIEFADPDAPSFTQVEHEVMRMSCGEWVAVRQAPRPQAVAV